MNISMINSLVSMHALQKKIDTIANNLANTNTIGYKSREVLFEDIINSHMKQPEEFRSEGRMTPLGLDIGFGTKVSSTLANFSQGQRLETNISTDMMLIGGDIFFTVVPSNGDPSEQTDLRYTRDGHFQLDGSRYLVTDNGDYILNTDGEPIYLPEGASFTVDSRGRIVSHHSNGQYEEIGTIKITKIKTPQVLEELGKNQYKIPDELTSNEEITIIDEEFDMLADSADLYSVIQGSLENSNIDLAKEMVQLNEAQKAYQFLSRGLSISDQMMGIANNLKG